jgi:hypothetical protein
MSDNTYYVGTADDEPADMRPRYPVIALETSTWSVDRVPVKVKPGTLVEFLDQRQAQYLLTALTNDGERRALTLEEWQAAIAEAQAEAAERAATTTPDGVPQPVLVPVTVGEPPQRPARPRTAPKPK